MSDRDGAAREALGRAVRADGLNVLIDLDEPRYDALERAALAAQHDPELRDIRAAFARGRRDAAGHPWPPVTPGIPVTEDDRIP